MGTALYNESCYVNTDLLDELVATARKIRQHFLSQKLLWRRIPCQTLLVNGRGGGYFDYYTNAYDVLKIPVSGSQNKNLLWLELKTGHLLSVNRINGVDWEKRNEYPGTSGLVTTEDFDWLQRLQETWWLAADHLVLDALCGNSLLDAESLTSHLIEKRKQPYYDDKESRERAEFILDYKEQLAKFGYPVFD